MKKLIALILALAAVFALGTTAFAGYITDPTGRSVYYPDDTPDDTPSAPSNPNASIPGLLICLMEDDTIYQFVPINEVTHVNREDAKTLSSAKRDALLDAVADAKAARETDGKKLRDAYWFEVPEKYTVDDEHYAKIIFSCKGTDVEVTVNGELVEIVSVTGRTTYLAKVTDRGAVVVRSR